MLRPYIDRAGPGPMTDRRWETRLLALLAAVLVVFGLTAVYGASSLLTTAGGQVGSEFALRQALGAVVGGIIATLLARSNYRRWQRYAWPMIGIAAFLLVVVLLPFTHSIAPTINGGRRWVNLGIVTLQPSELAKFAVVVWTAMLAAKKGERIRTFQRGLLPFLVIIAPVVGLIFLEPNLSMALLVAILAGVVLFTAGARIGHFLVLGVVGTPLAFGAVASAQYRIARVLTFLAPAARPQRRPGRCTSRSWGSAQAGCSAWGWGRGNRSWATCRTPTPISSSRRSARSGGSSGWWSSSSCSAPLCGSASGSRGLQAICSGSWSRSGSRP